jgi:hypothetical protein
MSNRPLTPTVEVVRAPTATVPPLTQPRPIAQENGTIILAPIPVRVSAAATFLNNVQIAELAVPEIVLERTPSPSQDNAALPPTPAPSVGIV